MIQNFQPRTPFTIIRNNFLFLTFSVVALSSTAVLMINYGEKLVHRHTNFQEVYAFKKREISIKIKEIKALNNKQIEIAKLKLLDAKLENWLLNHASMATLKNKRERE